MTISRRTLVALAGCIAAGALCVGSGGAQTARRPARMWIGPHGPGDSDIYVMNPDGGGRTRLTTGAGAFCPAWSPDGTRIAFTSARTGDNEIFVMNADGTGQVNLTNDP